MQFERTAISDLKMAEEPERRYIIVDDLNTAPPTPEQIKRLEAFFDEVIVKPSLPTKDAPHDGFVREDGWMWCATCKQWWSPESLHVLMRKQ